MHSVTLNRLQSFEDEARAADNPRRYLERLGPLHNAWHAVPSTGRRIGFLIFHWHVVEHFRALRLDQQMSVRPYTVNDFSPGGLFAEADWNASMQGVPPSQSLDDLVLYSQAIEGWHNEAHMSIGDVTGAPMMDPGVNIFYTAFWNLHFFINQRFEVEMQSYAQAAHPTLRTSAETLEHIEAQHHQYVRRI